MKAFHINVTLAAIGYAVAAVLSKQALSRVAGILRLSFAVNLVSLPVFATLLLQHEGAIPWDKVHQPLMTGGLFFLGALLMCLAIAILFKF